MRFRFFIFCTLAFATLILSSIIVASICNCAHNSQYGCFDGDVYVCECEYEGGCIPSTCGYNYLVESCPSGCSNGACISCTPNCAGKSCGDSDGCSGKCDGSCAGGQVCYNYGCCNHAANCAGKSCGTDNCGGNCGSCPGTTSCNYNTGLCTAECTPACGGKTCGSDGCGGSCGECPIGHYCDLNGYCANGQGKPICECDGPCSPGVICKMDASACTATPDVFGMCHSCNSYKGASCFDDHDCNPSDSLTDCKNYNDPPYGYNCDESHCCGHDEFWDITNNRCSTCYPEGSNTNDGSLCCQTPKVQYKSSNHCCPLGSEWDGVTCRPHDSCYRPGYSGYCAYFAPNYPAPQSSWWGGADCQPPPGQACCFVADGLYGYIDSSDSRYHWHTPIPITIY